jgi:hypothetical protein
MLVWTTVHCQSARKMLIVYINSDHSLSRIDKTQSPVHGDIALFEEQGSHSRTLSDHTTPKQPSIPKRPTHTIETEVMITPTSQLQSLMTIDSPSTPKKDSFRKVSFGRSMMIKQSSLTSQQSPGHLKTPYHRNQLQELEKRLVPSPLPMGNNGQGQTHCNAMPVQVVHESILPHHKKQRPTVFVVESHLLSRMAHKTHDSGRQVSPIIDFVQEVHLMGKSDKSRGKTEANASNITEFNGIATIDNTHTDIYNHSIESRVWMAIHFYKREGKDTEIAHK